MTDVPAVAKALTQADIDEAKTRGFDEGYYHGREDRADEIYQLRRDVKAVVDNLRAGIFTELRAIQELEALIGP